MTAIEIVHFVFNACFGAYIANIALRRQYSFKKTVIFLTVYSTIFVMLSSFVTALFRYINSGS